MALLAYCFACCICLSCQVSLQVCQLYDTIRPNPAQQSAPHPSVTPFETTQVSYYLQHM
jgi:hypothetical protein